jgi:hypothetical protein
MMNDEEWRKAHAIEQQAKEPVELAHVVLLLTSNEKAKREAGKEIVRAWKKGALFASHYRPCEEVKKP